MIRQGEEAGPDLGLQRHVNSMDNLARRIDAQGNLTVSVRVDRRITGALNMPGAFTGKVNNSANIGKTTEEFIALWNEANPKDLVESSTVDAPSGPSAR